MAFTDKSDIYVAVHENGVNQVVRQIMSQRPSLFNYGTAIFRANPELLCERIAAAPAVLARGNPLITVEDALPIIGSNGAYGLNFCVQFTKLEIDFFPGNVVTLPPELGRSLARQAFAAHAQVCGGIGCPPKDVFRDLQRERSRLEVYDPNRIAVAEREKEARGGREQPPVAKLPPLALPIGELQCFCLDLYVVGHIETAYMGGQYVLAGKVDGIEIVDIEPKGLENSIECYINALVQMVVVPKAHIAISKLTADVMNTIAVSLSPTPAPARVPNNPALEDDQVKVFIDLTAGPSTTPPSPGGGGGGSGPTRNISWAGSGPAGPGGPPHLTVAVAERGVKELFGAFRDNFKAAKSDSGNFGPFTAGYDVEIRLANGNVDLRSDNSIKLSELDIKFTKLRAWLGIDIPEICVGGGCIIPTPWGCAVSLPRICVFDKNPDIGIDLDLGGLVRSEVSVAVRPLTKYGVESTRPAGILDLTAEDMGIPNEWGVFLDPLTVDLDLFDIPDMVGDLLQNAITSAINALLPGPGWLKDLIMAILGPIVDLMRAILDIPDKIDEWLTDLLGVSLGLFDFLVTVIADYFASKSPLTMIEDPFPIAGYSGALVPIKLPLRDLAVRVSTDEMLVQGSVGV